MSKKKIVAIVVAVVAVLAAVGGGAWFFLRGGFGAGDNGDRVYVEAVKGLSNTNYGVQNRYSGIVEPQESWDVKKNEEKTIKEIFVEEGDTVSEGTPLFEYDTDEVADQIAAAELELEGIGNEISGYYNQIQQLESERSKVSEDEKFQYTTQIQSIQTSIKQAEYNQESKKVEIEKLKESKENSVVYSDIAGVVKSISEEGYDPYTGEALPFMTVLAVGDYRVKGMVNEQNVWAVSPGSPVLIRSRIDETQTWNGTISEVDTNEEESGSDGMMYDVGSGMETATKYPFYIDLETADGLMLGQHVYIEMDQGQAEAKEGIWLYESYIVIDESGSYVWADDGRGHLEKRSVELGDYDGDLGVYQILSGLTEEDAITYPMPGLYEGVRTVTDAEEVDYNSPLYTNEGVDDGTMDDGMTDDGMLDEGINVDDGMLDDGMTDDGMTDDGMTDDGMTDDGMLDDGTVDDGMTDDGMLDEGISVDDSMLDGGGTVDDAAPAEPEVSE